MAAMTPKRTPVPHVKPISEEPPSAFDAACSERLECLLDDLVPRESAEEQRKRAQVLATLSSIFREWVCSVCLSQGLPDDVANGAGGRSLPPAPTASGSTSVAWISTPSALRRAS